MKRILAPLLALAVVGVITDVRGEEPFSRLPSGPKTGQQIAEFRSQPVVGRHLCWSCYG